MSDFKFLKDNRGKWIISAPKRAKRPDQANGVEPPCPFELIRQAQGKPGNEEELLFQIGEVRVIPNKFPFAPIHEIIIHSDDHHKNFDELEPARVEDIFKVYQERFNLYKDQGQVYIFHNQGKNAGESLPHPHTQLTVIPDEVKLDIPVLNLEDERTKMLSSFYIFCPRVSTWPDEVWIAPTREGRIFGDANSAEISELSFIIQRLFQIFDLRHGHDFPFNFYIYPGVGWYLRIIPRVKILGGFEVGTGVFVNTQDPAETFRFIEEHFDNPDIEKIKTDHLAEYKRTV